MSDMSFTPDNQEYVNLKLAQLLFDEKVADMVEKNGKDFPSELLNNLFVNESFHLEQDRLNSVLAVYKTGLPPISVSPGMGNKYIVQNGRHRVAATILNGEEKVPTVIVDEQEEQEEQEEKEEKATAVK